ncbi:MAG: FMN-binding negative transcriptional regulator [Marinicella sp.]
MYPPNHHLDDNIEKSYRVIEEICFATIISRTEDDIIITQAPLILDRTQGVLGKLVGHMDKNNPHIKYLDNSNVRVIFNGPNTYISPNAYQSSQLPTWNSISVHVKGSVVITNSLEAVRDSIMVMTRYLETDEYPFILHPDNSRMNNLLPYVVGFEIEIIDIIGRFKLSQDKPLKDIQLAKERLIESTKLGKEDLINHLV